MTDVEPNQILGLEVTDESVQYDQMFEPLINQATRQCNEIPFSKFLEMEHMIGIISLTTWKKMPFILVSKHEQTQPDGLMGQHIRRNVYESETNWADIGTGQMRSDTGRGGRLKDYFQV